MRRELRGQNPTNILRTTQLYAQARHKCTSISNKCLTSQTRVGVVKGDHACTLNSERHGKKEEDQYKQGPPQKKKKQWITNVEANELQ